MQMKKRVLSAFMALCMVCSLVGAAWAVIPQQTSAAENGQYTINFNYNKQPLTTYLIDENGNPIDIEKDSGRMSDSSADVEDLSPDIDGYTYQRAVVARDSSGAIGDNATEIERIRYSSDYYSRWQYGTTNRWGNTDWSNISSGQKVYFIYRENVELTTVETVDSTAEGVHMYMFNYPNNDRQFNEGGYTENGRSGDVKEGLVNKTTNENGWPTFSGNYSTQSDKSLSWLFDGSDSYDRWEGSAYAVGDTYAVNHLFLQSKYDEDGTFYYSAFENFATLANDNNSDFTVYNALGSPAGGTPYYFQRGNFMPYNTLNTSNVISRNHYTAEGEALKPGDSGYNDPIYGLNGDADFHFGMYIWADFYQPQNGMVEMNDGSDSNPMIFEFTGDDDMWVFIDGVLVLDLGGIHDAQSGTINFATGEIRYTDTTIDQNHTDQPNTPDWHRTTIKAQYEAADQGDSVDWNGNTFADGSNHRIQIFYMERGEGASNLKISFNLKTIPDGQLSVEKEVDNYYAPQMQNIEYTMQVEIWDEEQNKYVPYANKDYTFFEQEGGGTTDQNGEFKLKHGQTAVFPDLQVNDKVKVQEVDIGKLPTGVEEVNAYDTSFTVRDSSDHIIDSGGHQDHAEATMPAYGSINVTVTNTATFTRPLKLVKNFEGTNDSNTAPTGFEATYTLYEVNEDGNRIEPAIGSIKYSDMINGEYTFWLETDKQYTIVESFEDGDNKGDTENVIWQSVSTADTDADTDVGIVSLETSDATEGNDIQAITLTNHYGPETASLTIIKNIYGLSREQVVGLIDGSYRTDGGLKFDIDYFETQDAAQHDQYDGEDFIDDWTFAAEQTLLINSSGFVQNGTWDGDIRLGKTDINTKDELSHYSDSSLRELQDDSGNTYYQYIIKISDLDSNDWYHVWETHVDVTGYDLESSVKASHNDGSALTEYTTDHANRSTAFQLTGDTTVEFTNRYTRQNTTLDINKYVTGTMGDTTKNFDFTITLTDTLNDNTAYSLPNGSMPDGLASAENQPGTYTFQLADKDDIQLTLPYGVKATITETDTNYTESSRQYSTPTPTEEGGMMELLPSFSETATQTVFMDANKTVDFQNTLDAIPPTDLSENNNLPFTLMISAAGLAGIALIATILVRRQRRRRE